MWNILYLNVQKVVLRNRCTKNENTAIQKSEFLSYIFIKNEPFSSYFARILLIWRTSISRNMSEWLLRYFLLTFILIYWDTTFALNGFCFTFCSLVCLNLSTLFQRLRKSKQNQSIFCNVSVFSVHWLSSLIVTLKKSTEAALQRCSENMQQIYRRTPMLKCYFNKVANKFIEIKLRHGLSSINLLHIFRTAFPKNTFGG